MVSVQVRGILPAVTDKKLRSTSISPGVSHGNYSTIMVLDRVT
jgi:hypothetical protein